MVLMSGRKKGYVSHQYVYLFLVLISLAFGSHRVHAMGLGELSHKNYLGERLDGRINILGAGDVLGPNIHIKLLSFSKAKKLGIDLDYPSYGYRFSPEYDGDTVVSYRLYSRDKVLEPYISLVVELTWPGGSLFREYALLFDAPPIPPPPSAPKTRLTPDEYHAKDRSESDIDPLSSNENLIFGSSYQVRPGDTLSGIAAKMMSSQDDVSVTKAQMINAIYQSNSHAFLKNNINLLVAGAELQLPYAVGAGTPNNHSVSTNTTTNENVNAPVYPEDLENKQGVLTLSDGKRADANSYGETKINQQIAGNQEMVDLLVQENDELRNRIEKIESSDYINTLTQLVAVQRQQIEGLRAEINEQGRLDSDMADIDLSGKSSKYSQGTSSAELLLPKAKETNASAGFSPLTLAIAENFWVVLSIVLLVFVIIIAIILYAVKLILIDPARVTAEPVATPAPTKNVEPKDPFGSQDDDDALNNDIDRNFHIEVNPTEFDLTIEEEPELVKELQLVPEKPSGTRSDYTFPRIGESSTMNLAERLKAREREDDAVVKERIRAKVDNYNTSPDSRAPASSVNNVEIDVMVGLDDEINELLSMADIYCSAGKYSEARAILTAQHKVDSNSRLLDAIEQIDTLERNRGGS